MTRLNVPGALALYLAWMGITCGTLLAGIGGLLPLGLGAIGPDAAFVGLIEAELFFVTVLWPFFIPRLILPEARATTQAAGPGGESHFLMLQIGVLLAVALPLAIVSRNLSQVDGSAFFRSQLLVGAIGCFVTVLLGRPEAARIRTWYFLGFFVVAALFPFVAFLSGETTRGGLDFLAGASPFWAAAQFRPEAPLSWAPGVQAAIYGALAIAILSMGMFKREPAVSDS